MSEIPIPARRERTVAGKRQLNARFVSCSEGISATIDQPNRRDSPILIRRVACSGSHAEGIANDRLELGSVQFIYAVF